MLIAVAAATSAVISRICAVCTTRISAISLVVVSVAAQAASRVLIAVTLSPPPYFSSAFSTLRAQAYSEMASYSALVTVLGAEMSAGVSLVLRRATSNSYPPRFAAMVAARVTSSHFPTLTSCTTVHVWSDVASHSLIRSSLKIPESSAHQTK